MSQIVIISGSPNSSSRLNGLVNYVKNGLSAAGIESSTIQVVELPAEDLVQAKFGSPAIVAANEQVATADAVIIASPVYKASYTGVLKSYIDLLPQKGFENKLISPLFIAGSMAHMLAVDYSLKPVLASMGANHYTKTVYAVDQQIERTEVEPGQYTFVIDPEIEERLKGVVGELVHYLKA